MQGVTHAPDTNRFAIVFMCAALLAAGSRAAAEEKPALAVDRWLTAGPVHLPSPAFLEKDSASWAVKEPFLDPTDLRPEAGTKAPLPGADALCFIERACGGGGRLDLDSAAGRGDGKPAGVDVVYLAGYMETWTRGTWRFELFTGGAAALYVDGKRRARIDKEKGAAGEDDPALHAEVDLDAGKHVVVLKAVRTAGRNSGSWNVALRILGAAGTAGTPPPAWSLDPTHTLARIEEYRRFQGVGAVALSPDARHVAIQRSRRRPSGLAWIEIRSAEDGHLEHTLRVGRSATAPRWFPDGVELAFRAGGDLLAFSMKTGEIREILRGEKGLQSFFPGPEGNTLYFLAHEQKPEAGPYTRLTDPRERLTDWDETVRLHVVSRHGGARRCLTGRGAFAVTAAAVSPDGGRLALVRRVPVPERPFFESGFWTVDLKTGAARCVKALRFPFENGPANLAFSPEEKRIAFTAPPAETGPPGAGPEHNAFDTCLWVMDLDTGDTTRISDRFDETVAGCLWWRPTDGKLYFIAQHGPFRRLARIDPEGTEGIELLGTAEELPTVVEALSPARGGGALAFFGSSLLHPARVYVMELETGTVRPILDPNAALMKRVRLGNFERFNFQNSAGNPIDGWIFFPPDFDPTRKWPMVVYYYGGVAPREERFSMLTYHWLPANGYVVYVLNPSGAVGYGRAFADKHVNDWGKRAGADIVEGVKHVLAAKPFVDPERIGCYGGSYGGFMTLYLAVTSDLFRACVSLYGIADIASYWGAGTWGYTYGDTALAGSYPWTRPDLFAGRSPLYRADQAHGALLLLHGLSDKNVPCGESEQMFTALRVLGKDAVYVRFKGEDHGLIGTFENLLAHRSMILEWFDKYLKDRPQGWERRWKK